MSAESILNRKALRDFHILERYEAGIELKGSEVKSIRAGKANIGDALRPDREWRGVSLQRRHSALRKSQPRSAGGQARAQASAASPGNRQTLRRIRSKGAPSLFSNSIGKTEG